VTQDFAVRYADIGAFNAEGFSDVEKEERRLNEIKKKKHSEKKP